MLERLFLISANTMSLSNDPRQGLVIRMNIPRYGTVFERDISLSALIGGQGPVIRMNIPRYETVFRKGYLSLP